MTIVERALSQILELYEENCRILRDLSLPPGSAAYFKRKNEELAAIIGEAQAKRHVA